MRLPIRRLLVPCVSILLSCCANRVADAQGFTFEAMSGSALNVPTPLTVSQNGYPDIRLSAHYDTKPFGPFYPYYSWRASFWNRPHDQAWEITQVHHRLFLANNPPEIQFFAIHFGYNFYMFGHAWKRNGFIYHVDGGILICSPDNTVRGQQLDTQGTGILDSGYTLAGGGGEFAVSRQFALSRRVFIVADGALLAGRARVPVANGSAAVPNVGFHGKAGVGFNFGRSG
jgi:hypothetical protein